MHGSASWNTNRVCRGWRLGLLAVGATIACALPMVAAGQAKAAPVYITLGFDDGSISQWDNRDVLQKYGVKATYFINSGTITDAGGNGNMNWAQLTALKAEGNEIGGHTKTHPNLTTLDPSLLQDEVCGDHDTLVAKLGGPIRNFAYPNGAENAAAVDVVNDCYLSGRTTRGIDVPGECDEDPATSGTNKWDCIWAETWPSPLGVTGGYGLYSLRAGENHLNPIGGSAPNKWLWTTSDAEGVKGAISRARNYRGGWFNIVLHDICVGPGNDTCPGASPPPMDYEIPKDRLDNLLNWICRDSQLQVVTTAQALGQVPMTAKPACPPPAVSPRSNPGVVLSINPLGSIASLKKSTKKRWKLTVKVKRPTAAKKLQLILDGRVIRTITKVKSTNTFTIKPGVGKHTIKVRTTGTDGKRYTSSTRTFHVKKAKKKKKKS